ncbi:MAG: hypothetical protein M1435_00390 [Actinobacteria bacterium]|nr:hypothetical protein [Actinomycetota bacterium]
MSGEEPGQASGIDEHVVVAFVVTAPRSVLVVDEHRHLLTKRVGEGEENSVMTECEFVPPPPRATEAEGEGFEPPGTRIPRLFKSDRCCRCLGPMWA